MSRKETVVPRAPERSENGVSCSRVLSGLKIEERSIRAFRIPNNSKSHLDAIAKSPSPLPFHPVAFSWMVTAFLARSSASSLFICFTPFAPALRVESWNNWRSFKSCSTFAFRLIFNAIMVNKKWRGNRDVITWLRYLPWHLHLQSSGYVLTSLGVIAWYFLYEEKPSKWCQEIQWEIVGVSSRYSDAKLNAARERLEI